MPQLAEVKVGLTSFLEFSLILSRGAFFGESSAVSSTMMMMTTTNEASGFVLSQISADLFRGWIGAKLRSYWISRFRFVHRAYKFEPESSQMMRKRRAVAEIGGKLEVWLLVVWWKYVEGRIDQDQSKSITHSISFSISVYLFYPRLADFPRRCSLLKRLNFAPHLQTLPTVSRGFQRLPWRPLLSLQPHALYHGNTLYRGNHFMVTA